MKKTKEIEKEENPIEKILKFESVEDAEEFEAFASGRKFCKKGERLQDICYEELENYICKNSGNLILKIYYHHKLKKNKKRLLLEKRTINVIRLIAINTLNEENNENITEEELVKKVREYILTQTAKYKKELEHRG